jgi:cardiolipin synthase
VAHDARFAGELKASLESAMEKGAHRIHRRAWRRIPWYARFASWLAYGLVRGVMGLAGYAQGWDGRNKAQASLTKRPPPVFSLSPTGRGPG